MDDSQATAGPILNAVSSSAKQLFLLLRCVNFSSRAFLRISADGLRVTVEDGRVMQGIAFLDRSMFSSYIFKPHSDIRPTASTTNPDETTEVPIADDEVPVFEFSLAALLEVLQMLGAADESGKDHWSGSGRKTQRSAFEPREVLGVGGTCRITYQQVGDPLRIVLEERGVSTTCALNTYRPEGQEDIPLQKDAIVQKIIMRGCWLHDAVHELSMTSPHQITFSSSPTAPYFVLSSTGPLGSTTVEFSKEAQLLETFQVPHNTSNTYRYSQIKGASRAMASASKVSIRTDVQGVLSLQFMIEVEPAAGGSGVAFLDFRFVPFLDESSDEELDDTELLGV